MSLMHEEVATEGRRVAGKGVGSNSSSLITSDGLFCSMGVNPHGHLQVLLLRGRETQLLAPLCVLGYKREELVALGFAQKGGKRPELICIAAGLQLRDELVDLGCLPISV